MAVMARGDGQLRKCGFGIPVEVQAPGHDERLEIVLPIGPRGQEARDDNTGALDYVDDDMRLMEMHPDGFDRAYVLTSDERR